jgi:hypothetical protein
MPGARCTRGLMCKKDSENAHEHTGQRRQSDIPCAMALWLIASSPRRSGFVCHRRPVEMAGLRPVGPASPPRDLTPTMRRQDHTLSPYANNIIRQRAVRSLTGPKARPASRFTPDAAASTASRPASLTIRIRPSVGQDGEGFISDLGLRKTRIFFPMGLDSPNHTKSSPSGALFSSGRHAGEGELTRRANHRHPLIIGEIQWS